MTAIGASFEAVLERHDPALPGDLLVPAELEAALAAARRAVAEVEIGP